MKKVLIIRFSSIGDIVLCSPVPRCIKNKYPEAEIHFLTKKSFCSILEANPYIDKVIPLQDSFKNTLDRLKSEKYDLIVDLHHNIRTLRIKLALFNIPARAFNKLNIKKWLLVNFKINLLPKVHIVDRYLACLKDYGIVNDHKGLDFFIPQGKNYADPLNIFKSKYLVYAIGGQHATKRLSKEKILELVNKIELPLILIGGREDKSTAEFVLANTSNKNLIDLCGKTSLFESAELVKNAELVISHDSGMMHISAAFNKKILSIWGNTTPDFGMYPYLINKNNSKLFEVNNLGCRPCSKIGSNSCPKGHFNCMNQQNINEMAEYINSETGVYTA